VSLFMTRLRWIRGLAFVATVLTFGSTGTSAAQTGRRYRSSDDASRIDTTFAFDKNGSITVNASNGDIVITGWSRDQVHVHAVSDDDNLRLTGSSSRVTLDEGGGRRGSDTRFEVSVPYGVRVLATSQSGDVSVRGTRGQVEARSQSGDIHVEDVATRLDVNTLSGGLTATNVGGDAEITTVSGDVKLSDVHGNVDVGTVSGEVELRGVTAKLVRAKTTSGDVTYDGIIDPAGRYEFVAHSGDIRLHVQRDASAQLTVSTWSGSIDSDFPITLKPGEHGIGKTTSKRFTFEIGAGAGRITAESFSGDITISSNGRGATERR
jgi:DUF4097 and DUF4098 domain-containing protein YvlB